MVVILRLGWQLSRWLQNLVGVSPSKLRTCFHGAGVKKFSGLLGLLGFLAGLVWQGSQMLHI
jgi:hypothetical protein